MPRSPGIERYYQGYTPGEAAFDLGGSLGSVVTAMVGPGMQTGYHSAQLRHVITDDAGEVIGNITMMRRAKDWSKANIDFLRLNPSAQGSATQLKDIVQQMLGYHPNLREITALRTSGTSAGTAAGSKIWALPRRLLEAARDPAKAALQERSFPGYGR